MAHNPLNTHRPLLVLLLGLLQSFAATAGSFTFDTHLHYNAGFAGQYSPARIIDVLRAGGIQRAVVTGYPPEQVLSLYKAAPERIVPLLGVYRAPGDKQTWTADTAIPAKVATMLAQGPWRGVGELHLFAGQRRSPVFLALVELAAERHLPLLLHCDPAVIDSLFEHTPEAVVIWAHAGAYPYPQILRDYLGRYPRLYIDLSVREARIAPQGKLDPDWEALLWEYPERFLAGVDTFSTARWDDYAGVAARIRGWLAQLPDPIAAQIGHRNAQRLYGTGTVSPQADGDSR